VSVLHNTTSLRVSKDAAERLHQQERDRLLADRKLILVCDLDQTLVHACVDPSIDPWLGDDEVGKVRNLSCFSVPLTGVSGCLPRSPGTAEPRALYPSASPRTTVPCIGL